LRNVDDNALLSCLTEIDLLIVATDLAVPVFQPIGGEMHQDIRFRDIDPKPKSYSGLKSRNRGTSLDISLLRHRLVDINPLHRGGKGD
jgi:hypothetical protein